MIRSSGGHASFEKVQRVLKMHRLSSSHLKKRQRSLTDSRKARGDEYENLTKDLEITTPFQVLSSDISYIRTGEGFDYLCQIRDADTNVVLARVQQDHMTKDIVLKALDQVKKRWHLPDGLIFHSDRSSQYTADEVMQRIATYGWRQSFFEYIEVYYNTIRVQKRLGYFSPIQYLEQWQAKNLTIVA